MHHGGRWGPRRLFFFFYIRKKFLDLPQKYSLAGRVPEMPLPIVESSDWVPQSWVCSLNAVVLTPCRRLPWHWFFPLRHNAQSAYFYSARCAKRHFFDGDQDRCCEDRRGSCLEM